MNVFWDRVRQSLAISTWTASESARHKVRRSLIGMAAVVGVSLVSFGTAKADFSERVNVAKQLFPTPANDCYLYVGAHFRPDSMAQGEAAVACRLRHATTTVYVRLWRWNPSAGRWEYLPWQIYTFNNLARQGPMS